MLSTPEENLRPTQGLRLHLRSFTSSSTVSLGEGGVSSDKSDQCGLTDKEQHAATSSSSSLSALTAAATAVSSTRRLFVRAADKPAGQSGADGNSVKSYRQAENNQNPPWQKNTKQVVVH